MINPNAPLVLCANFLQLDDRALAELLSLDLPEDISEGEIAMVKAGLVPMPADWLPKLRLYWRESERIRKDLRRSRQPHQKKPGATQIQFDVGSPMGKIVSAMAILDLPIDAQVSFELNS